MGLIEIFISFMPDWITTLLNLLARFTGGRGGIDHVMVNYGLAAIFYAALLVVARAKNRDAPAASDCMVLPGLASNAVRWGKTLPAPVWQRCCSAAKPCSSTWNKSYQHWP